MVDRQEISYGRRLFEEAADEVLGDWGAERLQAFKEAAFLFGEPGDPGGAAVYAFSLSERPDDAAQWTNYADGGRGYCMGFSTENLHVGLRKAGGSFIDAALLQSVTYDRQKQTDALRSLLKKVRDVDARFEWPADPKTQFSRLATLAYELAWPLLKMFVGFKHPGYGSEKEWRLVFTRGPHVHLAHLSEDFRVNERGLISFCRLEPAEAETEGTLSLRRVITGPRQDRKLGPVVASSYLADHGYRGYDREVLELANSNRKLRVSNEAVEVGPSELDFG